LAAIVSGERSSREQLAGCGVLGELAMFALFTASLFSDDLTIKLTPGELVTWNGDRSPGLDEFTTFCRRGETTYATGWLKLGPTIHWWIRRREGAVKTVHRTHC
jgi:hypothetical protein